MRGMKSYRRRKSMPKPVPREPIEVVVVFPDPIDSAQPASATVQAAPSAKTGKKRFPKRCAFRF